VALVSHVLDPGDSRLTSECYCNQRRCKLHVLHCLQTVTDYNSVSEGRTHDMKPNLTIMGLLWWSISTWNAFRLQTKWSMTAYWNCGDPNYQLFKTTETKMTNSQEWFSCVWPCVCHQLAYQACNLQNVVIVYAKQDAGEARPRPVSEWLKGFRTYSGRGVITSCGSLNTVHWLLFGRYLHTQKLWCKGNVQYSRTLRARKWSWTARTYKPKLNRTRLVSPAVSMVVSVLGWYRDYTRGNYDFTTQTNWQKALGWHSIGSTRLSPTPPIYHLPGSEASR